MKIKNNLTSKTIFYATTIILIVHFHYKKVESDVIWMLKLQELF